VNKNERAMSSSSTPSSISRVVSKPYLPIKVRGRTPLQVETPPRREGGKIRSEEREVLQVESRSASTEGQ
jgi:hypothetical protein